MVYIASARMTEHLLPLANISIYYHDVDTSVLELSRLVRTEANNDLERMRLDVSPTLTLPIDLSPGLSFVDRPKTNYLSHVAGMLLGGYSKWMEAGGPEADIPMASCEFWLDDVPMSGWYHEGYAVTSWKDIKAFYCKTLRQMYRTRELTICLRLYTHHAQQPGLDDLQHLVDFAKSYNDLQEPDVSLYFVVVVRAEYVFFFEHLLCWRDRHIQGSMFRVRSADVPWDYREGGEWE